MKKLLEAIRTILGLPLLLLGLVVLIIGCVILPNKHISTKDKKERLNAITQKLYTLIDEVAEQELEIINS